jgi:mono/diheme cytochrome c family protein
MNKFCIVAGSLVMALITSPALAAEKAPTGKPDAKQLERGRYLLTVGSCNDCHTAAFAPSDGKVPEKEWLLGESNVGFSGPWGTTYATNLRLSLSKMSEAQWIRYAKNLKVRPPMPWFNLNQWTEADLRAFYQYVRSLGPAGKPVRAADGPGVEPKTAVIRWPAPPAK